MTSKTESGIFIVFDGIDGTGKTEQSRRVASFLFGLNKETDVLLTREPTRHFRILREIIREVGTEIRKDAEWFARTFVEDRRKHVEEYILPAIRAGTHVVCDRYKYATLAYQQAQGMNFDDLLTLHDGLPIPDIIFMLDCSPLTSLKRRGHEGTDGFEKDIAFQEEVRQRYLDTTRKLAEKGENIIIIDAEKNIDEVSDIIISKLLELLLKRG